MGKIIPEQEHANAGRPKQPLVPRRAKRAQAQRLKIDRNVAGSLRCVKRKGNAMLCADGAHGRRILHCAAYVGAMGKNAEPRVGANERQQIRRVKLPFGIAGDAVKFHAGKLQKRAHYGVVFHRAYNAVIPRVQKALKNEVQPGGCAGGQNYVRGLFREGKQPCEAFPEAQRHKPRILRGAINGAVDGCTDGIHVAFHAGAYAFGFWERGCCVVEINRLHGSMLSFSSQDEHSTAGHKCHIDIYDIVNLKGSKICWKSVCGNWKPLRPPRNTAALHVRRNGCTSHNPP